MRFVMLWLALICAPLVFAADYKPPKGPDGKHPDLNGIWQALNEANWDLELHLAKPALQVREGPHGPVPAKALLAAGAVVSVPPGLGVLSREVRFRTSRRPWRRNRTIRLTGSNAIRK